MLFLPRDAHDLIVAHALGGFPDEACGFLMGVRDGARVEVRRFLPVRNVRASSRTYEIGPDGWDAADAVTTSEGWGIVGVAHSHTHSEAWPSPTDVDDADNPFLDPAWHYVIVSLRDPTPVVRSFLLADRTIREQEVVVGRGSPATAG